MKTMLGTTVCARTLLPSRDRCWMVANASQARTPIADPSDAREFLFGTTT